MLRIIVLSVVLHIYITCISSDVVGPSVDDIQIELNRMLDQHRSQVQEALRRELSEQARQLRQRHAAFIQDIENQEQQAMRELAEANVAKWLSWRNHVMNSIMNHPNLGQ